MQAHKGITLFTPFGLGNLLDASRSIVEEVAVPQRQAPFLGHGKHLAWLVFAHQVRSCFLVDIRNLRSVS